jgi:hypothetical protein
LRKLTRDHSSVTAADINKLFALGRRARMSRMRWP